jgi:hypothetical protein
MRKQDHLLSLVQSLSAAERRYFKLFSRLHSGEKNYLRLFEKLAAKTSYDAKALSAELGITPKQLAHEKQYLEEVLLKALRSFDETKFAENITGSTYLNIRVLVNRRQFQYAMKVISKALERVKPIADEPATEQLLRTKTFLLRHMDHPEELEKTNTQLEELLYNNWQAHVLQNLEDKFYPGIARTGNFSHLKNLLQHPLAKKPLSHFKTFEAKLHWHQLRTNYYMYVDFKPHKQLLYAKQALALCLSNPVNVQRMPSAHLNQMVGVCLGNMFIGEYKKALQMAHKMEAAARQTKGPLSSKYVHVVITSARLLKINVLCWMQDYPNAQKQGEQLYNSEISWGEQKGNALIYYAIALFHLNKPDRAFEIAEEILSRLKETQVSSQALARLLQIMIQVERKNDSLLPYLIQSSRSWMLRNKFHPPMANAAIALLTAISKKRPHATVKKLHGDLKQVIKKEKIYEDINLSLGLERWIEKVYQ